MLQRVPSGWETHSPQREGHQPRNKVNYKKFKNPRVTEGREESRSRRKGGALRVGAEETCPPRALKEGAGKPILNTEHSEKVVDRKGKS